MYYLIVFYSGQVEVEAGKKNIYIYIIFNFWIITTFNRKASQPSFHCIQKRNMLVLCNLVAAMQSVVIFTAKYYGYLDRNRLNMTQQPAPRLKKKTITNNPKYIDVYKNPTIAPIKNLPKIKS